MLTALLVIAILVFLIVVHELGHFLAAKIFRVRVDEFGFGFPPRAFLIGKLGDTEYTINWIPFGGFVRLFGEDTAERGRGSLVDAARWKQAIILVAGVAMNLITAWLLFTGAYMTGILHPVPAPVDGSRLIVSEVVFGSPAATAGFSRGDEIIAVEDADGSEAVLTPAEVTEFVSARAGKEIAIGYARAGATSTLSLQPAHAVIDGEAGRAAVGLGLVLVTSESLPPRAALIEAYYQTKGTLVLVVHGLGTIVGDALRGDPDLSNVVGPVGLVGAVGEASDNGWGYVLSLAAFISVNLVIVNLIPIPALDGGRLVIVSLESIIRRPAPKLAVQLLNAIGVALIIILMITVTYHDIAQLII